MNTIVIQKPIRPALLLSPDGSRDRHGAIVPTISGVVPVVPGQHENQAWRFNAVDAGVNVPGTPDLSPKSGTVVIRFRRNASYTVSPYLFSAGSNSNGGDMLIVYLAGGNLRTYMRQGTNALRIPAALSEPAINQWSTVVVDWSEAEIGIRLDGGSRVSTPRVDVITANSFVANTVRVARTGQLNGDIEGVVAYDLVLTAEEVDRIMGLEQPWTWDNTMIRRPGEALYISPSPRGSAAHIETAIYETDRDNVTREPLDYIIDVEQDWDIDRAGSKGRVSIASHRRVLRDGMWIATTIRIVPEVGEAIEQQTGHFRLDVPSAEFDGSVGMDGGEKVLQDAIGTDIVDVLAKAQLPFTFVTPIDGHPMSDVHYLIKLATMGRIGSNLVANHSFESEQTGWSADHSAGAGSMLWGFPGNTPVPDGVKMAGFLISGGQPVGARMSLFRDVPIPPGTPFVLVSGLAYRHVSTLRTFIRVQWRDEANTAMGSTVDIGNGDAYQQWRRHAEVLTVPAGAAFARVIVRVDVVTATTLSSYSSFDDIQVRAVTTLPIPDDRISLPPSSTKATTRIQTTGGASIGTTAINADRMAAISHHAINATSDGTLTTSPSRTLDEATATRTYGQDDYRFRGIKRIEPSTQNRYNTVTAIKESFDGTPPLSVTVWNDDPADLWSVHHLGNVGPQSGPVMIQDAVDVAALEAAARAALARATMQEDLVIQVAPDPSLTVYDVILIEGGPDELQGRWLVQALSGITPERPFTEVRARRSRSSVGVTYG